MEKRGLLYLLVQFAVILVVCKGQETCEVLNKDSGEIVQSISNPYAGKKCWVINPPEGGYVKLDVVQASFDSLPCTQNFIEISQSDGKIIGKFCHQMETPKQILAYKSITITFVHQEFGSSKRISIKIVFNRGAIFPSVPGILESQNDTLSRLISQRESSFGWGQNTHRAITALYLSGNVSFLNDSEEEERMAEQLELQTAVSLLRNSTDPISLSDLSMFINALTVSCYNPRNFYGYDLVSILAERLSSNIRLLNPVAYLTLCNANFAPAFQQTEKLFDFLEKRSELPFHLDMEAMSILALGCAKHKTRIFETFNNSHSIYNAAIRQLIASQLPDGSYGNLYTTALVTQALFASGQENNTNWKWNATLKFLIKELTTTKDFISMTLTLPIFNRRTLLDIGSVNCTKLRKQGEDEEISDIMNKLGGRIQVKYSLHVGDRSDIIHTIFLKVPHNSTVFEVMRVAQAADHKYKFQRRLVSNKIYVYEIAGKTNDPEAQRYWIPYIENSNYHESIREISQSLDKQVVKDGDGITMWYRTVQEGESDVYPKAYATHLPITSTHPSTRDPNYFTTLRSHSEETIISSKFRFNNSAAGRLPWTRRPKTVPPGASKTEYISPDRTVTVMS